MVIFIPKKVHVGYQERSDTYTGKLAYVIYEDEKGQLRKETSWNNWREHNLGVDILDNEPFEGVVLNKKVGDYSGHWNHRSAKVRAYIPHGDYEIEISIENMLFILEHCTSIKGKGLEGQFVLAWDAKELLLLPVDSPDYRELTKYSNIVHENYKLGARTVKVGATYLTKENNEVTYIGKFDHYESTWRNGDKKLPNGDWYYNYYKEQKQYYYFVGRNKEGEYFLFTHKGTWSKFIACLDEGMHEDYADMYAFMETSSRFSPVNYESIEFKPYTFEEFKDKYLKRFDSDEGRYRQWRSVDVISLVRGVPQQIHIHENCEELGSYSPYVKFEYEIQEMVKKRVSYYSDRYVEELETKKYEEKIQFKGLREIFDLYKPAYQVLYLENGNLYKEDK